MRQTGSVYRAMALHPSPLGRAAAVVRDGRDVGDGGHLQACGLQGADRLLTAGAGALDEDLYVAHAVLHGALRGAFRGLRGVVGRALARALEADQSRRTPAQHVPGRVRDRHDRVVERGLDVGVPYRDILPFALLGASRALPLSHGTPVYSDLMSDRTDVARLGVWTYFLRRMPTVRRGPRRCRAFVLVRCPRTGRLRRCLTPRYEPMSIRRLTFWLTSRRRSPSTL